MQQSLWLAERVTDFLLGYVAWIA